MRTSSVTTRNTSASFQFSAALAAEKQLAMKTPIAYIIVLYLFSTGTCRLTFQNGNSSKLDAYSVYNFTSMDVYDEYKRRFLSDEDDLKDPEDEYGKEGMEVLRNVFRRDTPVTLKPRGEEEKEEGRRERRSSSGISKRSCGHSPPISKLVFQAYLDSIDEAKKDIKMSRLKPKKARKRHHRKQRNRRRRPHKRRRRQRRRPRRRRWRRKHHRRRHGRRRRGRKRRRQKKRGRKKRGRKIRKRDLMEISAKWSEPGLTKIAIDKNQGIRRNWCRSDPDTCVQLSGPSSPTKEYKNTSIKNKRNVDTIAPWSRLGMANMDENNNMIREKRSSGRLTKRLCGDNPSATSQLAIQEYLTLVQKLEAEEARKRREERERYERMMRERRRKEEKRKRKERERLQKLREERLRKKRLKKGKVKRKFKNFGHKTKKAFKNFGRKTKKSFKNFGRKSKKRLKSVGRKIKSLFRRKKKRRKKKRRKKKRRKRRRRRRRRRRRKRRRRRRRRPKRRRRGRRQKRRRRKRRRSRRSSPSRRYQRRPPRRRRMRGRSKRDLRAQSELTSTVTSMT